MTATSSPTICARTVTGSGGLTPTDPGLHELQALVRLRDDQVRARTAATNQLTAILDTYWPGPKQLFMSLASQIALAFLTDYPTPQSAAHLGEARMAAFCRRHAYRGGKSRGRAAEPTPRRSGGPSWFTATTLAAMVTAQVTAAEDAANRHQRCRAADRRPSCRPSAEPTCSKICPGSA